MREIKFRAWDVETKQMRSGADVFVQFDGKRIVRDNYKCWESQCAVIGFEDCIDDITHGVYLMQFTGLRDKNGVDVYEGDVVRWADAPTIRFKWRVDYFSDAAMFFATSLDGYSGGPLHAISGQGGVEIIGNVYANPDLLK